MTRSLLAQPTLKAPGESGVLARRRDLPPIGSPLVRGMVDAAVMSSPPTISASKTTALTANKSPYWSGFRVSGAPLYELTATTGYPRDSARVNGTTGSWGGAFRIEFDTDAQTITPKIPFATGARMLIWVNEQPHAAAPVVLSTITGAVDTGSHYITINFGSAARRRIVLELMAGTQATAFNGLWHGAADSIWPPSIPSPRFVVLGDSYAAAVGATYVSEGYAIALGRLLGFADIFNQPAVGSTGIIDTNPTLYGNFRSRIDADVIPLLRAGDVLLYQASINDDVYTPADVAVQLASDLDYLQSKVPAAVHIIGCSPLYIKTPSAAYLAVRDAIAPVWAAAGLPFVDLLDQNIKFFYGTGSVASPNSSGNSDRYAISSVDAHPNSAGHKAIAKVLAPLIAAQLGITTTG